MQIPFETSKLSLFSLMAVFLIMSSTSYSQSTESLESELIDLQAKLEEQLKEVDLIETTAELNDLRRKLEAQPCSPSRINDLERVLALRDVQQSLLPANLRVSDDAEKAAIHAKLSELYAANNENQKSQQHSAASSVASAKAGAAFSASDKAKGPAIVRSVECSP